jgi:hypothetical protein
MHGICSNRLIMSASSIIRIGVNCPTHGGSDPELKNPNGFTAVPKLSEISPLSAVSCAVAVDVAVTVSCAVDTVLPFFKSWLCTLLFCTTICLTCFTGFGIRFWVHKSNSKWCPGQASNPPVFLTGVSNEAEASREVEREGRRKGEREI